MSKNTERSIDVKVKPSEWRIVAVSVMHALTLFACWLNSIALVFKIVLGLLVLFSGWLALMRQQRQEIYLRYNSELNWWLRSDNEYLPIRIESTTVLSRFLIILHWVQDDNRRGRFAIFRDALPASEFRSLLVCLKVSAYGQS